MTDYRVPAAISRTLAGKLQKVALSVHRALGLRDYSRVDIMMDEKQRPYVLEANSIPGFTDLSLLPKAARAAGISFELPIAVYILAKLGILGPATMKKYKN